VTRIHFWSWLSNPSFQNVLGILVAMSGLAGVYCSAMIYQDTRRTFWRTTITSLKFGGTTLLLGPATILLSVTGQSVVVPAFAKEMSLHRIVPLLGGLLCIITAVKLVGELSIFLHLRDREWTTMKRTAILMTRDLRRITVTRFLLGAIGGLLLPILTMFGFAYAGTAIFAFCLLGELLERYLFFTAVIPPKMPGGIA
jgi:formate dehydrogenase iron-sulfur subunit